VTSDPLGTAPFIETPVGWLWFHWLGDLYGQALYDLLRAHVSVQPTSNIGLCLLLPDEPQSPPTPTEVEVTRLIWESYGRFESFLSLGTFHYLLPVSTRRQAVVDQFDVLQFLHVLSQLQPMRAPEALTEDLQTLLAQ
jgi:hypothetical protein